MAPPRNSDNSPEGIGMNGLNARVSAGGATKPAGRRGAAGSGGRDGVFTRVLELLAEQGLLHGKTLSPKDEPVGCRQHAPRQRSKSTASGPVAVDRAPACKPRTGTCAAARSPGLGPILSRFCRDPGLSRDNSLNSGSYGPLRGHAHHITNVNDDGTIPAPPEPSWLSHNTFRSGDLSEPDGLAAPDLVMLSPESCINKCSGANQVTVWVQLGNAGAAPLTAGAKIEVYGVENGVESLIQEVPVDIVLQPGEYADAMTIDIDIDGVSELRLVAVPNEAECIVDSTNEVSLMAPFCVAPG